MNPDLEFNYKEYFRNAHYKRQKVYFEVEGWAGYFVTNISSHKNLHIVKRIYPDSAELGESMYICPHLKRMSYIVENVTETGIDLIAVSDNPELIELTFNYKDITIL